MAQAAKCLLNTHAGLRVNSRHLLKIWAQRHVCLPSAIEAELRGSRCLTGLAESVSSRFGERPCVKPHCGEHLRHTMLTSGIHTCANMFKHTMHTVRWESMRVCGWWLSTWNKTQAEKPDGGSLHSSLPFSPQHLFLFFLVVHPPFPFLSKLTFSSCFLAWKLMKCLPQF